MLSCVALDQRSNCVIPPTQHAEAVYNVSDIKGEPSSRQAGRQSTMTAQTCGGYMGPFRTKVKAQPDERRRWLIGLLERSWCFRRCRQAQIGRLKCLASSSSEVM